MTATLFVVVIVSHPYLRTGEWTWTTWDLPPYDAFLVLHLKFTTKLSQDNFLSWPLPCRREGLSWSCRICWRPWRASRSWAETTWNTSSRKAKLQVVPVWNHCSTTTDPTCTLHGLKSKEGRWHHLVSCSGGQGATSCFSRESLVSTDRPDSKLCFLRQTNVLKFHRFLRFLVYVMNFGLNM